MGACNWPQPNAAVRMTSEDFGLIQHRGAAVARNHQFLLCPPPPPSLNIFLLKQGLLVAPCYELILPIMFSPSLSTCVAAAALACSVAAQSVLKPPVLPLIVRNPYLSTWLPNARSVPWERWPMFYTGEELGFGVLASVPDSGVVYPLLGRPHDSLQRSSGYNSDFKLSFQCI
jgi:hypothetical protein